MQTQPYHARSDIDDNAGAGGNKIGLVTTVLVMGLALLVVVAVQLPSTGHANVDGADGAIVLTGP